MIKKLLYSIFVIALTLYSYAQPYFDSGNRYVSGKFVLAQAEKHIIKLNHTPVSIKAVLNGSVPVIFTMDSDGFVYKTVISNGKAETAITSLKASPHAEIYTNILPDDASRFSAPVMSRYGLLYITSRGELSDSTKRYPLDATKDNQIAVYDKYAVVLTNPTSSYAHGVLGDRVESEGFAVIDLIDKKIVTKTSISDLGVIEQKGALLADIDRDGSIEIILTISNKNNGAQVYAYSVDGELKYKSEPIGRGFRWRHVFAAAQFSGGFVRIVNVITPHIGGTLEFLEAVDGKLIRKSSINGVSTHNIGSANLGMGLAVDVDGDGLPEILAPDNDKKNISAYCGQSELIELSELIGFSGILTTEITALSAGDKIKLIGFGTDNKEVYIYLND
ncbi:MAG: hypothetical protein C0602_13990 [Denitrovibrio sp.]|nr:MAG: hypothetical protein C0602_13990 [Denitrovibrio sp.]